MFKWAVRNSPLKKVDVVVANAGISGPDPLFNIEGMNIEVSHIVLLIQSDSASETEEPVQPELKIVNVDLIGVMYTLKLARHYFMKHPRDSYHDRCLIVNASLVGFLDVPGIPQYMTSKWGCRGLMRCIRRTSAVDGVRMNLTGPW